MIERKKTLLLASILSITAQAGTMGPVCTPGNVTVPCVSPQWDLGLQGLYLKSVSTTQRQYRVPEIFQNGQFSRLADYQDWDWGYRLQGAYHFNTGNDVTLSYLHFHDNSNLSGLWGAYVPYIPISTQPGQYDGINSNRIDQVNIVMGQHADFGLVKKMRFYGGVQYANIQYQDTHYFYNTFTFPGPRSGSGQQWVKSNFKGIGPVVGIDYSYHLTNSWSVTANNEASILYGSSYFYNDYPFFPSGPNGANLVSQYAHKHIITPSLSAKLGLNYAYVTPNGVLNVQGGYQALNYFNVFQAQLLQLGLVGIRSADYGLYGPYFGIEYKGNA